MNTIRHFFKNIFSGKAITTPVAILIGALMLSVSHITYATIIAKSGPATALETFNGRAIDETDLATGKVKSDVVVVEYSDTECPFCGQVYPSMKKLQDEYGSRVSFVYRYFPLTQIHPNAYDEARALYCVGKVAGAEKRREYIDEIFTYKTSKQNMTLPKGGKEALAKNIGVDEKALATCMSGPESGDAVNASTQDGIGAGVQGTPSTFVLVKAKKGYEVVSHIDGARQYEYFAAAVEDALAR